MVGSRPKVLRHHNEGGKLEHYANALTGPNALRNKQLNLSVHAVYNLKVVVSLFLYEHYFC